VTYIYIVLYTILVEGINERTKKKPIKKKHSALLLVDGIYEPMDRWRIRVNIRVPVSHHNIAIRGNPVPKKPSQPNQ
jgi:hypothetical protein